jgi:hypothetical protein
LAELLPIFFCTSFLTLSGSSTAQAPGQTIRRAWRTPFRLSSQMRIHNDSYRIFNRLDAAVEILFDLGFSEIKIIK